MVNYGHFDSQWDKTLLLLIRSHPFSNSFEILSMLLISTSFMKTQQKIMKLRCSKRRLWPFLTIKGTQLCQCWSDLTSFGTRPRFYAYYCYLQVSWRSNTTLFKRVLLAGCKGISVRKCGRRTTTMDDGGCHPISSSGAFGSSEVKKKWLNELMLNITVKPAKLYRCW